MKPKERTKKVENACKDVIERYKKVQHIGINTRNNEEAKERLNTFIKDASNRYKISELSIKTVLKLGL